MSEAPGVRPPSQLAPAWLPLALARLKRSIVARALARAGEAQGV
jgi:hypothetical protein